MNNKSLIIDWRKPQRIFHWPTVWYHFTNCFQVMMISSEVLDIEVPVGCVVMSIALIQLILLSYINVVLKILHTFNIGLMRFSPIKVVYFLCKCWLKILWNLLSYFRLSIVRCLWQCKYLKIATVSNRSAFFLNQILLYFQMFLLVVAVAALALN